MIDYTKFDVAEMEFDTPDIENSREKDRRKNRRGKRRRDTFEFRDRHYDNWN